jgi:peptide/nickel transport system ATP-binding protein
MALLEVDNLQTHFRTPDGINRAVDGVSFEVNAGETLAIVGESGCGKSVTAMSILRLIPEPPGKIAGQVRFNGRNLLAMSDREMRAIRGNDISMIFQEPMTSLNPVLTVGRQIGETLACTRACRSSRPRTGRRDAEPRRHPGAKRRVRNTRTSFGGMRPARDDRHRARLQPEAADRRRADHRTRRHDPGADPDLMRDLKHRVGAAIVLITHDLGVVAEVAERWW